MKSKMLFAAMAVGALLLVFSLQGCMSNQPSGGGGGGGTGSSSVNIKNFAFDPANLTIKKGTTVTWTNNDNVDHTVTTTSGPESFDSGNIKPGGTYTHTFNTTGNYSYFCKIHPYMTASVTVQ